MGLTPPQTYRERVIADGASHYWPLDETTGTTAADVVGGAHGTISGGVTLGVPGAIAPPVGTVQQQAYLQARSGIARSDAIRSNYIFPLLGVLTVDGVDMTSHINYGSLRITLQLNDQPDTASFELFLDSPGLSDAVYVGADVLIDLGGASGDPLFGGRILTMQTRRGPARTPSVRSVMCADYLQVLDSEYLVTYNWPAQSATTTILDLINRFTGRAAGAVLISPAAVQAGLPSHAAFGVINERISTVLRRLVTMLPDGGGFYIDPLKVLHVWSGASEPNMSNPQTHTLDLASLKAFAETVDGSQQRDAVIVEGRRTNAPIGTPGPDLVYDPTGQALQSIPVLDASIGDAITDVGSYREARIGTQRFRYRIADGVWSAPAGTPQTTTTTADVAFDPAGSGDVQINLETSVLFTGRSIPWARVDEQYLRVVGYSAGPPAYMLIPRTGFGAMIGPIKAGAPVTVIDSLSELFITTRYNATGGGLEQVRAQPIDSDVVMTVRSEHDAGLSIHEQLVQDGRFVRAGATARGQQEILDFRQPIISIEFETDDLNARPGRLQVYDFGDGMAGDYMILTADLTWPVWGQPPRRQCRGADVRAAQVIDTWLTDTR